MQTAAIVLFLLSAAALFYITLGYPILVALHRRSAPAIRKEFIARPVSVLIAVHNGQQFLRAKLESVLALDYPRELMEILVVSDASTDDSEAIADGVRRARRPTTCACPAAGRPPPSTRLSPGSKARSWC